MRIQVDLSVFGDAPIIETRVPRSVFGQLHVGDEVLVVDDGVSPRPFTVEALSDGDRDARLIATDLRHGPTMRGVSSFLRLIRRTGDIGTA